MRVLGIDPGLATTGIGLISSENIQDLCEPDWFCIQTKAGIDAPTRLAEIATDLTEIIASEKPNLAVVEKLFFETNVKTAISVAEARGVILATLASHSVPIIEPTPMQLKSAITGDGRADKTQMQDMMVRLLNLTEIPQPDDAADALGLAIYGAISQSANLPIC